MAKGGALRELFAEMYGKATGVAGGKGGSMHLQAPEVGVTTASAVVASTISHAVGAALAAKLRRTGQVAVTAFGDGATEEGTYHESLNFAAVNPVPVVFLCENNGLSIHASLAERQAYDLVAHARQYRLGVTHIREGWDFLAVREQFGAAVDAARAGGTAQVVVVDTFRYKEHVGPNEDFQFGYRDQAAYRAWSERDPLIADAALAARLAPAIEQEIDEAVAFAEASPWPSPQALLEDVI
jgi:pyruvate dehydrogenase E1 component alpha subunit